MTTHIHTVIETYKALDRHERSRVPRVSLQPSMPAPRGVIHMPTPDVYDLPATEFYRMGDVQGSA